MGADWGSVKQLTKLALIQFWKREWGTCMVRLNVKVLEDKVRRGKRGRRERVRKAGRVRRTRRNFVSLCSFNRSIGA
jgi:hypothetical protein